MKAKSLLTISTVLALGLLVNPVAFAQDGDDGGDDGEAEQASDKSATRRSRRQARKHFKEGAKLAAEQRYDDAVEAFRKAYEFDPQPETLYNLGTVSRLKGDARAAYGYYEKYLAVEPKGSLARSAKRFMESLQEQIAEEDARLAREKSLQEQAEKTRLEAEKARVEAEKARHAQAEALKQAQAALAESREQLAAVERERDALRKSGGSGGGGGGGTKRLIGTALMGVGGLVLGLGIKSGLDARSAHNELSGLGMDDSWSQGYDYLHDYGETSESRMILFSITGAVLVGGGITLYLLGQSGSRSVPAESKSAMSITPSLGKETAGLQVTGRF